MEKLEDFCMAFQKTYLKKTISIRDTNTRKELKENFYHGILLGIFGDMDGWDVQSNAESGEGYSERHQYKNREPGNRHYH